MGDPSEDVPIRSVATEGFRDGNYPATSMDVNASEATPETFHGGHHHARYHPRQHLRANGMRSGLANGPIPVEMAASQYCAASFDSEASSLVATQSPHDAGQDISPSSGGKEFICKFL